MQVCSNTVDIKENAIFSQSDVLRKLTLKGIFSMITFLYMRTNNTIKVAVIC